MEQKVRNDMEFPTIDKFAKEVAEKALDEIKYEGKTIREWVEIISKQQISEDCINREDAIGIVARIKGKHIDDRKRYQINYGTICDIDLALQQLPSVTPKTSCESCREQVLKHLEKEDWADTVNCVMNMPFMNKPCVSEGVCREDKIQVLDKIRAEIENHCDFAKEYHCEYCHQCCNLMSVKEILKIIDKYKAESEVNNYD